MYQCDQWNRLCQVTLPQANAPPGTPGILVKHYLYDGVGRLIRVQSPYPDPQSAVGTNKVRSERIFYDGVRRIQELVTDPLPDTASAAQQGNTAARQTISTQSGANLNSTSAGAENSMLGTGGGGGLPSGLSLAREYVWGPGDRGIDELLCQYGPTRAPSYPLHDGGGDIIALVDKNGAGATPRLLWQATYDAYGQVVEEQTLVQPHTYLHAGHKGLFFDRLDGGIVDPVTFQETPRLMPANHAGSGGANGARLIGYARNRQLHTGFGRWLQRDPNASGQGLIGVSAIHGWCIRGSIDDFDLVSHYQDGANVLGYLDGSPTEATDPLGLWVGSAFDVYFTLGTTTAELAFSLAAVYSENLDHDVAWALDWSLDDDMHTRGDASWIQDVYDSVGIDKAVDGYFDPFMVNDLSDISETIEEQLMAGGAPGPKALHLVSLLHKGKRLSGKLLQLHHVLPKCFGYIFGKSSPIGTYIPKKLHDSYHKCISQGMQRVLNCPASNAGQLKWKQWINERAKSRYGGNITMVQKEVEGTLKLLTDQWGRANDLPGLGAVLRQILP